VSLLLGLFDRPADAGCLKALWKVPAIPDRAGSGNLNNLDKWKFCLYAA
jgi:hypothetical protein